MINQSWSFYHSFLASAVFKMNELFAMFLRYSLLLLCFAVENNNKFNSKSICYDLNDHYPIFVKACDYCKNLRTRHAVKTYRTFKLFIPESFTEDLPSKQHYFF